MRIALVPVEGGRPVELGRELTLVGRSEEADLKLDHKSVSKLHCVLVRTPEGLLVRDLGSTNGTRINGQRIRRGALVHDDVLNLAHYTFRVELTNRSDRPPQHISDNATLIGNLDSSLQNGAQGLTPEEIEDPNASNYSLPGNVAPPRILPPAPPNRKVSDSSVKMAVPPPAPPANNPLPDRHDD